MLGQTHLLVHVARNEGVPRAVLEAFHASVPVIATRAGGIPDVVEDDVSGYLVDVAMLRQHLIACIQQPELRARLAAGGRKIVEERYNIRTWLDEYKQLFSTVARRHNL